MFWFCLYMILVNFEVYSIIGGVLGWKIKGSLDFVFEEIVFVFDMSMMSSFKYVEVKIGYGYYIIMVGFLYMCLDGFNIIYRLRDGSRMIVYNIIC